MLASPQTVNQRLRCRLIPIVPVLMLALSICAILLSHSPNSNSKFLQDLAASAFFEVFWSVILIFVVLLSMKRSSIASRSIRTALGVFGFVLIVTMQIVPMLFATNSISDHVVQKGDLAAMCLVVLTWILGIWWAFASLAISIEQGDWDRTVWSRSKRGGGVNQRPKD